MAEVSTFPTATTLTGAELLALVQGAGGVKITTLELLRQTAALAEAFTFGGLVTLAGGVAIGNAAADPFTVHSSALSAPNGLAFSGGPVSFAQAVALNGGATIGDASGDGLTINSNTLAIPNTLNINGNVGFGTASRTDYPATAQLIDLKNNNGLASLSSGSLVFNRNAYLNAAGTGWLHKAAGVASQFYMAPDGSFAWVQAPSAAAGAAVAFTDKVKLDSTGNFMAGVTSASTHTMARGAAEDSWCFNATGLGGGSTQFYSGHHAGFNAAAACQKVSRNTVSARSINAAGSVNANGADYAEYVRKNALCGTILKGQICGIDASRRLVTRFAEMVRPAVKSTDPSYVGGDRWGTAALVGARPVEPVLERPQLELPSAPEPVYGGREPPAAGEPLYELKLAAYEADRRAFELEVREAAALYAEAVRVAQEEHAAEVALAERRHGLALEAHKLELAAFEEKLEAERVQYDRITWSGQVPAIVAGEVVAGAYVIAEDDGAGGICGRCYLEPTLAQLRHKVGFVMVANPTEAQFRELVDASIPIEPGWNAILDVGR